MQQRRLPGARLAYQRQHLPALDVEVHTREYDQIRRPGFVDLGNLARTDISLGHRYAYDSSSTVSAGFVATGTDPPAGRPPSWKRYGHHAPRPALPRRCPGDPPARSPA